MAKKNVDCQVIDFLALEGVASKTLGGTADAWTFTYPMTQGASYAFEYALSSAGTIAAEVVLEQGNTVLTDAQEGLTNTDFVVPEDAAAFDASVVDANTHIKAYAPAAAAFGRLKFTGTGSNAATTVISKAKMTVIKGG